MNLIIDALPELWFTVVVFHDVEAFVDRFLILQREHQPTAQQTTSHRTHRLVDDIQQRLTVILHRMNQFEAADGELIQSHIPILLNTGNRGDMAYLCVLCLFEVLQDGPSGDDTVLQVIHAKAL